MCRRIPGSIFSATPACSRRRCLQARPRPLRTVDFGRLRWGLVTRGRQAIRAGCIGSRWFFIDSIQDCVCRISTCFAQQSLTPAAKADRVLHWSARLKSCPSQDIGLRLWSPRIWGDYYGRKRSRVTINPDRLIRTAASNIQPMNRLARTCLSVVGRPCRTGHSFGFVTRFNPCHVNTMSARPVVTSIPIPTY